MDMILLSCTISWCGWKHKRTVLQLQRQLREWRLAKTIAGATTLA